MSELWTDKYAPKAQEEFIGNSEIVRHAFEWARLWEKGEKQPPLLLWGQSGAGKTALAYLVARHHKWDIIEMNSSDLRSRDAIEKVAGAASQSASIFSMRRLILLDEVDALTREDSGGASAIQSMLKGAANPIILTANDIFADKSISGLRFVCKTFEFKKINYVSMAARLREILAKEGAEFSEEAVKELAKNSSGDMRSALLDLQTLSLSGAVSTDAVKALSPREREQKIFSVMKAIFSGTDFKEVREARSNADVGDDLLFMWIDENIPRQYKEPQELSVAFDRLSRADVFKGRIMNRQYWGFLRYVSELSAEGVALAKENPPSGFVMYQFPSLLSMLSKSSGARALKKSLGGKIAAKTHSSSREIISRDLPYLKAIMGKRENAVSLAALCNLDEKEVAFLLETSPDTKKVQSVIEEAAALRASLAKPKPLVSEAATQEAGGNGGRLGVSGAESEQAPATPSGGAGSAKDRQTRLF